MAFLALLQDASKALDAALFEPLATSAMTFARKPASYKSRSLPQIAQGDFALICPIRGAYLSGVRRKEHLRTLPRLAKDQIKTPQNHEHRTTRILQPSPPASPAALCTAIVALV